MSVGCEASTAPEQTLSCFLFKQSLPQQLRNCSRPPPYATAPAHVRRAGRVLWAVELRAKMPTAWMMPALSRWWPGGGCMGQGGGALLSS